MDFLDQNPYAGPSARYFQNSSVKSFQSFRGPLLFCLDFDNLWYILRSLSNILDRNPFAEGLQVAATNYKLSVFCKNCSICYELMFYNHCIILVKSFYLQQKIQWSI